MPASGLYTTKEIQDKLVNGVQDILVKSANKINKCTSFLNMLRAGLELIPVVYRLWRLSKPTHNTVNKYNSHVMIDLRDWFLEHDKSYNLLSRDRHSLFDRHSFYEVFFNFVIMKYEFDDHMGKRLEKWLEKWYAYAQAGRWVFTHKHPETQWELNEADKKEPTVIRQKALKEALHNKDYAKVLNLID